jgi:hypothetical protein
MRQSSMALQRTLAALAAVLLLLASADAQAALHISGTRASMTVEADNTSLRDVLEALKQSFGLRYHAADRLDEPISGTYSGSLQRVLSRLLTEHDYVIRPTAGAIDVTILASDPSRAGRAAPPARYANAGAPATWKDGDGRMIAAPVRPAYFARANARATWRDGDGNLIAPPGD